MAVVTRGLRFKKNDCLRPMHKTCEFNNKREEEDLTTEMTINIRQMATKTIASATVRAVKKRILPSRAALVLTPSAVNKVKEIMAKEDGKGYIGLKVGVRQRGCNGLSYTLDYASTKGKLDEEVKQDGVTIIIDKKAQLTLLGTEMDYVEDKLSAEFVFNNPNIKGTCGCGESFSI